MGYCIGCTLHWSTTQLSTTVWDILWGVAWEYSTREKWSLWVAVPVVASGGPNRTYWHVLLDWPDIQRCQVKNDDVSDGGNTFSNVGGGGRMTEYG